MEVRRIQETGKGTYIVSIPKKWAQKLGITKGTKVSISFENGVNLVIKPVEREGEENKEREVTISSYDILEKENLIREIVSYYLSGYDVIKVFYPRSQHELAKDIKNFVKSKLIGLEVIEESSTHMVLKNLVKHNELPLIKIIERMSYTALYMVKDAIDSLLMRDKALAISVLERDDEIDRFYFYAVRQLKQVVSGRIEPREIGITKLENTLDYRLLVKSLERIGDHATKIADLSRYIDEKSLGRIRKSIEKHAKKVIEIVEDIIKILEDKDREQAHKLINKAKNLQKIEDEIVKKHLEEIKHDPFTAANIRIIMDSLRRITDYATDIGEIIININ